MFIDFLKKHKIIVIIVIGLVLLSIILAIFGLWKEFLSGVLSIFLSIIGYRITKINTIIEKSKREDDALVNKEKIINNSLKTDDLNIEKEKEEIKKTEVNIENKEQELKNNENKINNYSNSDINNALNKRTRKDR